MGCRKLSYYEGAGSEEKSPLRIFSCIEEKNDSPIFFIDYSPFGLEFNSFTRSYSTPQKYKFQGQEKQEETGWVQFKWRNADPAIGRFFNIDPLAESFYHNSTYAFSENRVIDGIELEGLEYLDADAARVMISNQRISVNKQALTRTTQSLINRANLNTSNWGANSIGVDMTVKQFESAIVSGTVSRSELKFNIEGSMKPQENNYRFELGKTKNRFGVDDQRLKDRSLTMNPGGTRSGRAGYRAAGLAALIGETYNFIELYNLGTDKAGINADTKIAEQAIADVNSALGLGLIDLSGANIPSGFGEAVITESYLYMIADYVLRGNDSDNDVVRQNGERVWQWIQNRDREEQEE